MDLKDVSADIKAEFESLQQEFDGAVRTMQGIGNRLEAAYAKVSSFHKQVVNEALPNPEVNATNPPAA